MQSSQLNVVGKAVLFHQVLVVEGIQTSSGEGLDAGARSFAKSPAACSGRRVHVPALRILCFH